ACKEIAQMLENGEGCKVDQRQALRYYEKAATAGLLECYSEMSRIYLFGGENENAEKCWRRCFANPNLKTYQCRAHICVHYLESIHLLVLLERRTEVLCFKAEILEHLRATIELIRTARSRGEVNSLPFDLFTQAATADPFVTDRVQKYLKAGPVG